MKRLSLTNNRTDYRVGQDKIAQADRSFLQAFEYGQLQEKIGNQAFYVLLQDKTEILKSWLFILFKAKRGVYLFCPYGNFSTAELELVIDFWKKWQQQNLKIDFLRISPLCSDNKENLITYQQAGFRPAPVHMMHPELDWRLDITKNDQTLLAEMRKNNRYGINKAKKDGVKILTGDSQEMLNQFYLLHEKTARRQGFIPWSKQFLDAQRAVFAPLDAIKIYLAEYDGQIISGAIIMFYEGRAYYHHGASDENFNKIPSSYLIQWEAIQEAKKRGFPEYSFYGVIEDAPKHPWAGLSFFKKGFGGAGKHLLHCQDYAFSARYWLIWLLEKYQRWRKGY